MGLKKKEDIGWIDLLREGYSPVSLLFSRIVAMHLSANLMPIGNRS